MNLRDLPHGERPRERLIERGAGALSDAELLAILLRTGRAGENVLELARGIVARFRETGLSEILAMPAAEFARIPGVGTAKAATVLAALELGRRAQGAAQNRPHIREHFLVLPLTSKNQVLMVADVSVGTLTNTLVHPREVYEPAIRCGAAHIVLAHNHPSGDPAPSAEDHRLTRQLKEAGALLGIPVTDHVILGGAAFFSFSEEGML